MVQLSRFSLTSTVVFRESNDNEKVTSLSPDYVRNWLVVLFVRGVFARTSNHWRCGPVLATSSSMIHPFLSADPFFFPFANVTVGLHAISGEMWFAWKPWWNPVEWNITNDISIFNHCDFEHVWERRWTRIGAR